MITNNSHQFASKKTNSVKTQVKLRGGYRNWTPSLQTSPKHNLRAGSPLSHAREQGRAKRALVFERGPARRRLSYTLTVSFELNTSAWSKISYNVYRGFFSAPICFIPLRSFPSLEARICKLLKGQREVVTTRQRDTMATRQKSRMPYSGIGFAM